MEQFPRVGWEPYPGSIPDPILLCVLRVLCERLPDHASHCIDA
jgi:hypothetical protein